MTHTVWEEATGTFEVFIIFCRPAKPGLGMEKTNLVLPSPLQAKLPRSLSTIRLVPSAPNYFGHFWLKLLKTHLATSQDRSRCYRRQNRLSAKLQSESHLSLPLVTWSIRNEPMNKKIARVGNCPDITNVKFSFWTVSLCLCVSLSLHHSDQMSEGSQASKVIISGKLLKRQSDIESVSDQGWVWSLLGGN